jgi:hypothetical protein
MLGAVEPQLKTTSAKSLTTNDTDGTDKKEQLNIELQQRQTGTEAIYPLISSVISVLSVVEK